jgi:hypothetical protein
LFCNSQLSSSRALKASSCWIAARASTWALCCDVYETQMWITVDTDAQITSRNCRCVVLANSVHAEVSSASISVTAIHLSVDASSIRIAGINRARIIISAVDGSE